MHYLLQEQNPATLPGIADLVPNNPVLYGERCRIEAALNAHESKIQAALAERRIQQSNPSHLPNQELRQADEAVKHLLKELAQQRETFTHYLNSIVQVCHGLTQCSAIVGQPQAKLSTSRTLAISSLTFASFLHPLCVKAMGMSWFAALLHIV